MKNVFENNVEAEAMEEKASEWAAEPKPEEQPKPHQALAKVEKKPAASQAPAVVPNNT